MVCGAGVSDRGRCAAERDRAGPKLDPVYTARTMAALLDRLPAADVLILYWHTHNGV